MTSTISTVAVLLQLAASLLTGAQHNPQMPLAAQQQIIAAASQTIQLSTQALVFAQGQVNFPVVQNTSKWPNIKELQVAPYIAARGGYTPLGAAVQLDSATVSFGDLNGDGYDDAMVMVKRIKFDGSTGYDLAAMLNQGGIMFNIADTPLGNILLSLPLGSNAQVPNIASHQIENGEFVLDSMGGAMDRYVLLGNQLIKAE